MHAIASGMESRLIEKMAGRQRPSVRPTDSERRDSGSKRRVLSFLENNIVSPVLPLNRPDGETPNTLSPHNPTLRFILTFGFKVQKNTDRFLSLETHARQGKLKNYKGFLLEGDSPVLT